MGSVASLMGSVGFVLDVFRSRVRGYWFVWRISLDAALQGAGGEVVVKITKEANWHLRWNEALLNRRYHTEARHSDAFSDKWI
jgi:hypothetical protein